MTFSTAYAGPTLTRYLADYGAEVIKIESKRRPDNTRGFGGSSVEPVSGVTTGYGFGLFNRNKRDIAVDMTRESGRELIRRLVKVSDVLVENFSLGVLHRWGLDYERLRCLNPALIVLDMQGLGQTGPRKDYASYGPTLHSYVGYTSLWGYPQSGPSMVDYVAAAHGVVAVLAALWRRRRSGRGVHIDLGQAQAAAALLGVPYLQYFANGQVMQGMGNKDLFPPPTGCYRCKGEDDAWCFISVPSEAAWRRLVEAMGRPAWAMSRDYRQERVREAHADELHQYIETWTCGLPPEAVERLLQQMGVPCAAVRSPDAVSSDPHLRARGFFVNIAHPVVGETEYPGLTIRLSKTPGEIKRHAPLLGQDNEYVLHDLLGLPRADMVRLEEDGVLA